jgi:hypothetical protein
VASPWTDDEHRVLAREYFFVFREQEAGRRVVKTESYKKVRAAAGFDRSDQTLQDRCQRISQVLDEHGIPWVRGWTPSSLVGRSRTSPNLAADIWRVVEPLLPTELPHLFGPGAAAATSSSPPAVVVPIAPARAVGKAYVTPPPLTPLSGPEPFDVDPDLVDRGREAHRTTIDRLARWVTGRGFLPLIPEGIEPKYDLAWLEGDVLNVAEIKSITDKNEEGQLRLGLGQVIRYRQLLRSTHTTASDVRAWLVPEREPTDASWRDTCYAAGITLLVPPA